MTVAERVGVVAKAVLDEEGATWITYGDLDSLHEVYDRMGWPEANHPLDAINRVLSALQRHCKRPGALFTEHRGRWGLKGQSCRGFKLATAEQPTTDYKP